MSYTRLAKMLKLFFITQEENVIIIEQVLYWAQKGWRIQPVLPDTILLLYYEEIVWEVVWKS